MSIYAMGMIFAQRWFPNWDKVRAKQMTSVGKDAAVLDTSGKDDSREKFVKVRAFTAGLIIAYEKTCIT